jgi:lipopolysaccharide export system protein LptA
VRAPVIGKATVEGGKACVFYGPSVPVGTNPDVAVPDSVRVVLVVGPDATKWFNNYRHKVHAKTIAGLGDEAFYDGYASISVLKGNAYVRIAVGVASNLGPEEMLARDALPRM